MPEIESATTCPPQQTRLAGFWRRLSARLIDGLILAVFGHLLGVTLYDELCRLGPWGRPLGLLIALAYFVPLTSSPGGGQTIDKRLLNIRVVDKQGQPLSVGRAGLREFFLLLPFFLNNALLPPAFNAMWTGAIVGTLVFILGPGIAYFAIFNRRTRQSLHDLIANSFVVDTGAVTRLDGLQRVWAGHYVIMGIFVSIALVGSYILATLAVARMPEMKEMLSAYRELQKSGRWYVRSLTQGRMFGSPGSTSGSYVQLIAVSREPLENGQRDTVELARTLFSAYPGAAKATRIIISDSYGYDIGMASVRKTNSANYTVEEWRTRLSTGTASGVTLLQVQ